MKTLAPIYQLTTSELTRISYFLPAVEPIVNDTHYIPVCEPDISAKETRYVNEAVSSSWISSAGNFVVQFENKFAEIISHTRYAYAVNSGTSALHLAVVATGIGRGDEVIVPTFTMIATINALMYCGATPVFVDADPISWNMDTTKIESAITKKQKLLLSSTHMVHQRIWTQCAHLQRNITYG